MKAKISTIILLLVLSLQFTLAQDFNRLKMDSLFNILAGKQKAMGSVTISKNGTVLYSKAIGYSFFSDNEKKPSTTLTRYRIGSITKMFTATMIFQLIEEGRITLSTTLNTYFPALPNADKITIGNLLSHRSGLHNFTDDPDYTTWMTTPKTEDQMLAVISGKKPDFQSGEKTAYSNSNFVVLGYIIEKITGQPYSKNLKERIISKIGLTDTYYGGKTNISQNESFSYKYAGVWEQLPETDMSIPGGAGAVVSTPTDLVRFIEALFSLKLISVNSLTQMGTVTNGIGMGMLKFPFYDKKAFGHNGGIDGFASNVAYFPDDHLAISYCTNGQVYPMNDILIGILSICFNRDYQLPAFNTFDFKTEDPDKYPGVYSSTQIPLKITISKNNAGLTAQATGQSAFPLEATGKDEFRFDQAGIKMEFNTDKNEMTLYQGGGTFVFTREK